MSLAETKELYGLDHESEVSSQMDKSESQADAPELVFKVKNNIYPMGYILNLCF